MFQWFNKKEEKIKSLFFKSTDAAFEYAAEYLPQSLSDDAILVGQVMGKAEQPLGKLLKTSSEKWCVRMATDDGIISTNHCGSIADDVARNLKSKSPALSAGDLVLVQVGSYNSKYPIDSPLQYFIIMCKLLPELSIEKNAFVPDIYR